MPTRCWAAASLLALLLLPALAAADGLPGVRGVAAGPGKTRLLLDGGMALVVARDAVVPAQAAPAGVEVLARVGAGVLVLVDRYPSRLNRGQGACGAGEESFLRVLRVLPPPATQTYVTKLASCHQNIELRSEPVWDTATALLTLDWLAGPTQQAPETRRLLIAPDGSVQAR